MKLRKKEIISKRKFEFEGIIDCILALRHDVSLAGKSAEMMTGIRIVRFDNVRVGFADYVTGLRQNFSESVPIISIENTVFEMLHFVVEPAKCRFITSAKHPCNCSTISAINCL